VFEHLNFKFKTTINMYSPFSDFVMRQHEFNCL